MPNITKVTAEGWIDAGKQALINEGVSGISVNRIAQKLGVTRGGFYHNFKSQQDYLARLLDHWRSTNTMFPDAEPLESPDAAISALDRIASRIILEEGFSPNFDRAVREWARVDELARHAVDEVDHERLTHLAEIFKALGCDDDEAAVRARVFYFHQVGYYALGYETKETKEERMARAGIYMRILCGRRFLEAVEVGARKWL